MTTATKIPNKIVATIAPIRLVKNRASAGTEDTIAIPIIKAIIASTILFFIF